MSADSGYSAHDVAEVLSRLSAVVDARQIQAPVGAQDLQAWWAAVAEVAGDGTCGLDANTLQYVKGVYDYIEKVIISCGTPDAFDVYEVCFETLTKVGFFLKFPPAKEGLLHLLEEVHEVFDVLLSCIETYEWVQPGATGLLRLWMLQVVFACFDYKQIQGRDLMELTDNDICGAVSLIAFLLRCPQAPFDMQAAAGRCLMQLTTADSVFLARQESGEELQSQQIAKLTGLLNRHVNGLIKGLIQFEVVDAFGHCICQHQMSHARTDIIVKYFLSTVHNCLLYCSENQRKLRQHLAVQSTIIQDIMIPYVHNILPALYDNPACGPGLQEWQNLKSVLQTFVVVTFNINVFRPQLRDSDMLPKIFDVPCIFSHISMIELLIKLAVNVDYARGPYFENLTARLQAAFEALPPDQRMRLQRRLTSEQSTRLPMSRSSSQAMEAIAFALTPPTGMEGEAPEAVALRQQHREYEQSLVQDKGGQKKKLMNMQSSEADGAAAGAAATTGQDDDDCADMPPLISADGWQADLGAMNEIGVPTRAICPLSGTLMHDPVATPDGCMFDRASLEDWMQFYSTNPLTGVPLSMSECVQALEVQSFIQNYQLQMLSACMIAPEAFDEPPPPLCEAPAAAAAPPPMGPQSLLGDLPTLGSERQERTKKDKGKIKIESRSVVDCPDDMRCAIDGKVMTMPLRSPYGHCFEKKTLEKWIGNCGSTCPITSQPLRLEDCQQDSEMKKRIVRFLKGQA